jgi:opacity protein-like surface antigen
MKAFRLAAGFLVMLAASAAAAQDWDRTGLYAQFNGVTSFESFDGVPSSAFDTAVGVGGRLGFRLSRNFAVESMVEWSGDFVDCCGADLTSTLVAMNGRYYVLTDQWQPYVTAGLGWGFADVNPGPSEDGFVLRFGGGLDYYISETWGLTGEFAYDVATGDLDDFNYMTLGWGAFIRF